MDTDKVFAGSIPKLYETYLVPLIFAPYAADLAKRLAARDLSRVLEIAAGTGVVTRAMAATLKDSVCIVATDLNQAMLDHAAATGTARPVAWRQADALALPFADGEFDAVVCQFGAMFFPDKAKAFAEARRVLRRGGIFIFNVWDRIAEQMAASASRPASRPSRRVAARRLPGSLQSRTARARRYGTKSKRETLRRWAKRPTSPLRRSRRGSDRERWTGRSRRTYSASKPEPRPRARLPLSVPSSMTYSKRRMASKIRIRAKPGSRTSTLEARPDGTWVARLKAPPVDGKANAELIALVAEHFGCRKADVVIRRGAGGRMKLVEVP